MQSSGNTHKLTVSSTGTNKRHLSCLITHHNNHYDILKAQASMLIRSLIKLINVWLANISNYLLGFT